MKKTFLVLGIACASLFAVAQSDTQKNQNGQSNAAATTRDAATGQASGKRMHKPMMLSTDQSSQADAQSVNTARETSSGMATGRREASTGMATGKASVQSPRDAATGQASGKQMQATDSNTQPAAYEQSVTTAREASSGMATGRTAQAPMGTHHETELRESPSKASIGKTSAMDDWNAQNKNMNGAQSNPMYKDNTMSGTNPLYESSQKITKSRSNIQNNRVAAGDVNGDGAADAVVKSKSNITNNRVAAGDVNGDGKADVSVQPSSPAQMKGDPSRGHQPDTKSNDKKTAPRDAATGQASGKAPVRLSSVKGDGGNEVRLRPGLSFCLQRAFEQRHGDQQHDQSEAIKIQQIGHDGDHTGFLQQHRFESVNCVRKRIDPRNRSAATRESVDRVNRTAGEEQQRIQNAEHRARHQRVFDANHQQEHHPVECQRSRVISKNN